VKVTKDIVRDLLPAYLAGEATAETCAVVEEYLAKEAELRQIAEAARTDSPPRFSAPVGFEVQSLERTRRLLGQKNFWLAFALIFCLAAPIVKPLRLADLVMLIGLAGWAPFLNTCRNLMATGVTAARGWRPRILWSIVGALLGVTVAGLALAAAVLRL
jgi:predicted anti-sigma-YlaC factor YlaD